MFRSKLVKSAFLRGDNKELIARGIILLFASALAMCLMLVITTSCGSEPDREISAGKPNQFAVMSTTDIHGKIWDKDVLTGEAQNNNMLRASTAVQKVKKAYNDRTLLFDNGDLYQGTQVSEHNIIQQEKGNSQKINPAAICLEHMNYDAYCLGNHEFNYMYENMKNTYQYLNDQGIPCVCANLYFEDTGIRVFQPYMLKTINIDGHDLQIAVIGLENTDCPRWDLPQNYQNIIFHAPENSANDAAYEIKKVQQEMEEKNVHPDFTILAFHSGLFAESYKPNGSTDYEAKLDKEAQEPLVYGKNTEGQAYRAVRNTKGIDMIIAGHDHVGDYSGMYCRNSEGNEILIVNGACTDLTNSIFNVTKNQSTGKFDIVCATSENMPFSDFKEDANLKAKIKPYADEAEQFFNRKVGKIAAPWEEGCENFDTSDYFLNQSDDVDLINRCQMYALKKMLPKKYKNVNELNNKITELYGASRVLDSDHPLEADISLASVGVSEQLKDGDFYVKDAYKLFRYNNSQCMVVMSGQQIKYLLEYNAESRYEIKTNNDGQKTATLKGDKFTCPIVYGINFKYCLSNPVGSKVVIDGFSNGRAFDLNKNYIVAINSYHLGNNANDVLSKVLFSQSLWTQIVDDAGTVFQDYIVDYVQDKNDSDGAVYATAEAEKNSDVKSTWSIEVQ